jgi:hypothetical protein
MKCEDCSDPVPAAIVAKSEELALLRPFVWTDLEGDWRQWTRGIDGRWYCSRCIEKHTIGAR